MLAISVMPLEHVKLLSLLLIEDSRSQADRIKEHFENLGYLVAVKKNGRQGISYLQQLLDTNQTLPNFIVVDLLLTDSMDGIEICRRIKSDPDTRLRNIPILLYSCEDELEDTVQAYQAGADYYVFKGQEGLDKLSLIIETSLARELRRVANSYSSKKTNLNPPLPSWTRPPL